jgi:glycosyltransferase involved in cell wall biosynthesis
MITNNYPLVTIGMPTYNRANSYLRCALESATQQSYPNIEIVVSDNCSTDNTEVLIRGFKNPRVRYFRQPMNIGPIENPNFCVKMARGDYFLQLHDDDMIDRDFVELCMQAAGHSKEIGVIQTGVRRIDSDGKTLSETPNRVRGESIEDFFRGWFYGDCAWYLCNTIFNLKRLKEIGGFPPSQVDDGIVISKLVKFGVARVEDVKASFRKHAGEITFALKVEEWCRDYLRLLDIMCELISDDRRAAFRNEGMRFFSRLNYNRAMAVKGPVSRAGAYLTVYRKFGVMPSRAQVPLPISKAIGLGRKIGRIGGITRVNS